jgi:hypothetical protein
MFEDRRNIQTPLVGMYEAAFTIATHQERATGNVMKGTESEHATT